MHMIDLSLHADRLIRHAASQGHNHEKDEDLGYALHGWLRAALGDLAPRPFRLLEQRANSLRLLGYADTDIAAMKEAMQLGALPLAAEVCDWQQAASKDLQGLSWPSDRRLGFEVRVCPVVRGKQGERDAFLAQLPEDDAPARSRAETYQDWLVARLAGAAAIDPASVRLKAFRLVSLWRQMTGVGGSGSRGRAMIRPDALLSGQLIVHDPAAFQRLLRTGIGRHCGFGFGMLLLRPV